MSYLNKLLASNERIARITRDHWITLASTILVDTVLSIVIIGLSVSGILLFPLSSPWTWFGFLLLIVPLVHLMLRLSVWWSKQYVVTNRRIIQISGLVNTRVSDTSLEKINDIVMEQSALGRMLKFGDLEIISGSESGIDIFYRIADPIGFKKELLDQKAGFAGLDVFEGGTGKTGSDAGDVPELITELDELRQRGVLTAAEFEEKKRKLLDTI